MRRSVRNSLKVGVPLVAMGLVGLMLIPAQPARIGTARIAPIAAAAKAAGLPIPGGARAASLNTPTPAAARLEAQLGGPDTVGPDTTGPAANKSGVVLASLTGSPPATTTPDAAVPAGTQPDVTQVTDGTQPAAAGNGVDTSNLPAGQIGSSAVNVRSGPSSADSKLFVMQPGESVKVGETSGGWVHVYRQDGTDGWIYGRYLNIGAAASTASAGGATQPTGAPPAGPARTAMTPPAQSRPAPARLPPPQTASMARLTSVVPLLQRPDDFGTTLGVLQPGERVRVLNSDGRWLHVVTEDGASGWIPA